MAEAALTWFGDRRAGFDGGEARRFSNFAHLILFGTRISINLFLKRCYRETWQKHTLRAILFVLWSNMWHIHDG